MKIKKDNIKIKFNTKNKQKLQQSISDSKITQDGSKAFKSLQHEILSM